MTVSVDNVVAANPLVTGAASHAPRGTALPAAVSTALDADAKGLGYIDEAGLVETPTRTTDNKKAWGGDTIKVLQTDYTKTFQFTLVEYLNPEVAKAVNGADNVTVTPATSTVGNLMTILDTGAQLPHESFVFDMKDGLTKIRKVVPDGQITDIGAITHSSADVVSYQVTLTAFWDPTLGGYVATYTDDGKPTG